MHTQCVWSTDLCSQVVSSGQVFEPEQAVPVACPSPTRIVLHNLKPEITHQLLFHQFMLHAELPDTLCSKCRETYSQSSIQKGLTLY